MKIVPFLMIATVLLSFMMMSFAAPSVSYNGPGLDPTVDNILKSDIVNKVMTFISAVINPISAVALGANIIGLMLSSSSKQSENAIKAIKAIIWAFVLLNTVTFIIEFGITAGGGHTYHFTNQSMPT